MGLEYIKKRACYPYQINRCTYKNVNTNDYDYSLENLIKRSIFVEFDERYLDRNFIPTEKQTPFKNIVIADLTEVIPEQHKDLLNEVPEYPLSVDIEWFVKQLKGAIKRSIVAIWDSSKPHLVFHSSGHDSRILSSALKELEKEKGKEWLGKVYFRCHQPENDVFMQIMEIEGWGKDQYGVWEGANEDHYDLGIKELSLNGFSSFHQQMNFWSDIVPQSEEKKWVAVSGEGGEMFKYMAMFHNDPRDKKQNWCNNTKMNLLIAHNPDTGDWEGHWANIFNDAIMPFFTFIYQREAQKLNPSLCKWHEDKSCDNIRLKLMNSFGFDFSNIKYEGHRYNWTFSEKRKKEINDAFYSSKLYQKYGDKIDKIEKINKLNFTENLNRFDGKLWGFMTLYETIHTFDMNKINLSAK